MFCNFNLLEVSIFYFVVSVDLPCGKSFPQVICIFGLCVSFPWWPCPSPHPYSIPSGFWKCLHSVVSFIFFSAKTMGFTMVLECVLHYFPHLWSLLHVHNINSDCHACVAHARFFNFSVQIYFLFLLEHRQKLFYYVIGLVGRLVFLITRILQSFRDLTWCIAPSFQFSTVIILYFCHTEFNYYLSYCFKIPLHHLENTFILAYLLISCFRICVCFHFSYVWLYYCYYNWHIISLYSEWEWDSEGSPHDFARDVKSEQKEKMSNWWSLACLPQSQVSWLLA